MEQERGRVSTPTPTVESVVVTVAPQRPTPTAAPPRMLAREDSNSMFFPTSQRLRQEMKRAQGKMAAVEERSVFFQRHSDRDAEKRLPRFERSELSIGKTVGVGQFNSVREITSFQWTDAPVAPGTLEGRPQQAHRRSIKRSMTCVEDFSPRRSSTSKVVKPWKNVVRLRAAAVATANLKTIAEEEDFEISFQDLSSTDSETESDEDYDEPSDGFSGTGSVATNDTPTSQNSDNAVNNDEEDKVFMRTHCFRPKKWTSKTPDEETRYVVKKIRRDLKDDERADALVDLATEAKFLAVLKHPNIVRMRGTGGTGPCHFDFFVILDRISFTLEQKIVEWGREERAWKKALRQLQQEPQPEEGTSTKPANRRNWGSLWNLNSRRGRMSAEKESAPKSTASARHIDLQRARNWRHRLTVCHDVARAMRYIHGQGVVFRDLKPENVGIDHVGVVKLFDFGFCRELLPSEHVYSGGGSDVKYQLTGLTGSLRYMAPEVALCQPYGKSADVYSFGIFLWQVLALKLPYDGLDVQQHREQVVLGGQRPDMLTDKQDSLVANVLMPRCWTTESALRPTFGQICDSLTREVATTLLTTGSEEKVTQNDGMVSSGMSRRGRRRLQESNWQSFAIRSLEDGEVTRISV